MRLLLKPMLGEKNMSKRNASTITRMMRMSFGLTA